MPNYTAPLDDLRFALDLAGLQEVASWPGFEDASEDLTHAVLEEAGKFASEVLAPINRSGDQSGPTVDEGVVTTSEDWRQAYAQFSEAGWTGLVLDPEYGGQGLPQTLACAVQEMWDGANMAFGLCPMLSQTAAESIFLKGSDEQKAQYLPSMVTGKWTGTMNLTEPHAGSDVGALTTKATPGEDGTWLISGTKIFITYGEHELSENIIHLVLARTPDAPPGTKGISLFIVPKFLVNEDGSLGERNDLRVVSSEHKIGIHASPTCVMSYGDEGGAVGWMVGEENSGMRAMFTMMNNARLSVGLQGLSLTDRSYQQARQYSIDRKQGKAIGAELAAGESSTIADHADVRRMLMTMRANAEAMRCVMYANAASIDFANSSSDASEREYWDALTALLTPISKGWGTDLGVEMTSLGVQTHGGMGYVEETGVAQHWRDVRIAPIYEGTNGIQAADLVFRKLPLGGGQVIEKLILDMGNLAEDLSQDERLISIGRALDEGSEKLREAGLWLGSRLAGAPNDAAAGATPFMRLAGVVIGGYYLARSAKVAQQLLDSEEGDTDFLNDKIATARFYAEQVMPTVSGLVPAITQGAEQLFAIPNERL